MSAPVPQMPAIGRTQAQAAPTSWGDSERAAYRVELDAWCDYYRGAPTEILAEDLVEFSGLWPERQDALRVQASIRLTRLAREQKP